MRISDDFHQVTVFLKLISHSIHRSEQSWDPDWSTTKAWLDQHLRPVWYNYETDNFSTVLPFMSLVTTCFSCTVERLQMPPSQVSFPQYFSHHLPTNSVWVKPHILYFCPDSPCSTGSLPGQCNFESGVCGYIQDNTGDEADWLQVRGHTPTSFTGPRGDHTTGVGESFSIHCFFH